MIERIETERKEERKRVEERKRSGAENGHTLHLVGCCLCQKKAQPTHSHLHQKSLTREEEQEVIDLEVVVVLEGLGISLIDQTPQVCSLYNFFCQASFFLCFDMASFHFMFRFVSFALLSRSGNYVPECGQD